MLGDTRKGVCEIEQRDKPFTMTNLTHSFRASEGAHIFYIYSEYDKYIENTVDFIAEGLEKQHSIVLVESQTVYNHIIIQLKVKHFEQHDIDSILYINRLGFNSPQLAAK